MQFKKQNEIVKFLFCSYNKTRVVIECRFGILENLDEFQAYYLSNQNI